MSAITIETIQAKQTELAALIERLLQQPAAQTRDIQIDGRTITLAPGEHYAGAVLDADGNQLHHLVLMAARPTDRLHWQDAMDWVNGIGGSLPTRQELALLFANCRRHLEELSHWSSETYEDDASSAWCCYFNFGSQTIGRKGSSLSAVAVRRI